MDKNPAPAKMYFLSEQSSFAKLKATKFYDDIFFDYPNDKEKFVVIEFEVIEDYYRKFASGTLINLPIRLNILTEDESGFLNAEDVKNIFETEFCYAYFSIPKIHSGIEYGGYLNNGGFLGSEKQKNDLVEPRVWFDVLAYKVFLHFASIIPIVEGKVDFSVIFKTYDNINARKERDELCNYLRYCERNYDNGTDYETLENNIKELYQKQLSNK